MISLQIIDVKDFMSKLLLSDVFQNFLLSEAAICTYNTFTIDGRLHPDFYSGDELEELGLKKHTFSTWKTVRPVCFELIRGKTTPLHFKIVFLLSPENVSRLLEQSGIPLTSDDINGLFLNIKFNRQSLQCTTGTSLKLFTLDKTLEHEWDSMIQKFFKSHEIPFELL